MHIYLYMNSTFVYTYLPSERSDWSFGVRQSKEGIDHY